MGARFGTIDPDSREAYVAERVEAFAARCREHGLSVTPQRRAIMRALLASEAHPRAEEIYEAVRAEHPTISLATVHRTLDTLCQIGEARKVTALHHSARYDGNVRPHHHLVCIDCRRIVDVEAPEFDEILSAHRRLGEFEVLGCSVEIHVRCGSCREAKN
jgi:Fur family transcriptional regulator, peroxide stress response regulator